MQDVQGAGCAGCRMCRMQGVQDAGSAGCRVCRMQDVQVAGCAGCRVCRVQDARRNEVGKEGAQAPQVALCAVTFHASLW